MCYSAQIAAEYKVYQRLFGARLSIKEFYDLYWRRTKEVDPIDLPLAMEAAFAEPETPVEHEIKALIDEYRAQQALKFQQLLFEQKTRLVNAERSMLVKPNKRAENDQRVASKKIDWAESKLAALKKQVLEPDDSRIYPKHFAPVMVVQDGELVVLPMRYQCRLPGKPAAFDAQFPGTYNARRDNLNGFWKGLFGRQHGIVMASAFYEHVKRHRAEGRELRRGEAEEDQVLEFRPETGEQMFVACLWSRWRAPGQHDLLSFAAITDDPPPEVAAAGHDRCIIPIKHAHVNAWLNPGQHGLTAMQTILDGRQRPYFEHRLAA